MSRYGLSSIMFAAAALISQVNHSSAFVSQLHSRTYQTQQLFSHKPEYVSDDVKVKEEKFAFANQLSRRQMITSTLASMSAFGAFTSAANARYVLNEEGDYDEVTDEDWQTEWKKRLDKANSMSTDEIFNAARGAGNNNLKQGEESEVSKKRRAMSACRDSGLRSKAGVDAKTCNSRVMGGEVDFILGK